MSHDDGDTPPEHKRRLTDPHGVPGPDDEPFAGIDTGKVRLIAQHEADQVRLDMVPRSEVNGFFSTGEKLLSRAKMLLTVVVAIGGAGTAFGIWKSTLATHGDLDTVEARMIVLELHAAKMSATLDLILRSMDKIKKAHETED